MAGDTRKLITFDQLRTYDTGIKTWTGNELEKFSFVKKDEATSGYAATYEFQFDGVKIGDAVDIPKDFLVKSATIKAASVANTPIAGLAVGAKYFDFEINTRDLNLQGEIAALPTAAAGNEGYVYKYIGETDATYTNGTYYVCIKNGAEYEWTATTVTSDHIYLAVSDAFAAYLAGNGIDITNNTITADIDIHAGIEFTGSIDGSKKIGVNIDTDAGLAFDGTSGAIKINADTTKALAFDGTSGKLEVKVDTAKALDIDSTTGVQVKVDTTKAVAIDATNGIEVVADATKGLTIDGTDGLQINNGTGIAFDVSTGAVKVDPTYTATGTTSAGTFKGDTTIMPTAGAEYANWVYHFTGTTDATYTNGKYYKCTESSGTYSWVEDTTGAAGTVGLMTSADKDLLNALAATFGTDVTLATDDDINALFN